MPNLATVLKSEVARLTRKELKLHVEPLQKQVAAQNRSIAALRGDITKLQRGITSPGRKAVAVQRAEDAPATRARFSPSGLRRLRARLGLTLASFGILFGASAQTIFKWENGSHRPRAESIQKIAIVRGMTKRQVEDLLAQHAPVAKPTAHRGRQPVAKKGDSTPAAKASNTVAKAVTKNVASNVSTAKKVRKSVPSPASKSTRRVAEDKADQGTAATQ